MPGGAVQPDPHLAGQAALYAGLRTQAVPPGLQAPDPADVPARMAVYRNNVAAGLGRALAAQYPAIERLVGPAFFAAAARVFAAEHPPRSPVLQAWGGGFAGWIEGFAPAQHLVWLGDVARLEWLRAEARCAADAVPADPARLVAGDPAGLRLRLAPSVRAFASAHPAVAIWAAQQPGAGAGAITPGPSFALIGRRPDHGLVTLALSEAEHGVLLDLRAGARLGALGADPTRVLTLLLTHGLIAGIETE